jgi:hypothetical protein
MAPARDVDPNNLASSGWGVIFAPDVKPEVEEALRPLLELRKQQAGLYFKRYVYQAGQTKQDFLATQSAGPGPANPRKVPYYLLLVGEPKSISFRFQCELDIQYAVGRIHFESAADYASYARSVVATETQNIPLPRKQVTFFSPQHAADPVTTELSTKLIAPLARNLRGYRGWRVISRLGPQATKGQLRSLFGGNQKPAILFTATHGLSFPPDDARLTALQGALLCQEWPGPAGWQGEIPPDFYFSADDLDAENESAGMIVVMFGSWTAGAAATQGPQNQSQDGPSWILENQHISRLAQRLLSNPRGGALAVIGFIDRVWTTSSWSDEGSIEAIEDTLKRLLSGAPVGAAMEYVNQRYAELSVELSGLLFEQRGQQSSTTSDLLTRLQRASDDARHFIVLGDPAVRLVAQRVARVAGDLSGAASDKGGAEDQLDFVNYIEAFADLIESPYTQLPITVGIFGSWGMGKSFLLNGLKQALGERHKSREQLTRLYWLRLPWPFRKAGSARQEGDSTRIHVVTFNAWEYSASETIWPGLVRKIMDQLEREVPWPFPGRFLGKLWRNLKTLVKKERVRALIVTYLCIGLAASGAFYLWPSKLSDIWKAFIGAGIVGLLAGLLKLAGDTWANPLSQWLTNLFLEDDYGRHIGHLARIRKDLEFLEGRLRTDENRVERVLILIDDLDRCEPNKAVEMLQTINLLLDFKSFVVFLGIDARIITCAIEKHYQGLLGEAGASGYEYLDKIVQIPFRIPVPLKSQVETYLEYLMGDQKPPAHNREASPKPPAASNQQDETAAAGKQATEPAPGPRGEQRRNFSSLKSIAGLSKFTYEELDTFKSLAGGLSPNPRHLKRLVNVYRLVRTLADSQGEETLLEKPGATICWLVLCAQWPYTTHLMVRNFESFEREAERSKSFKLPDEDPLLTLLTAAEKELDPSRQQRLDQEPDVLRQLISECQEARMTWEEFRTIRRYTINFNPAIEAEARADSSRGQHQAEGLKKEIRTDDHSEAPDQADDRNAEES